MQSRSGYEKKGTEVGIGFFDDADRIAEWTTPELWKIGIGCISPRPPIVLDVVCGIEWVVGAGTGGNVCGESASVGSLLFHKVPKGNEVWDVHYRTHFLLSSSVF